MGLSRAIAMVMKAGVVAGVTCALALGPAMGPAAAAGQTSSRNGVSAKAIDLLEKVQRASLVEIWAGQRAQQFGNSAAVKWVGRGLLNDHIFLKEKVEQAAAQWNVKVPTEPDLQQQAGIRKMARVTGKDFDLAFANTLHFGHSLVLPVAQQVQAEDSSNPTVRQLASLGVTFVSKHIAWLEATGLVTAASSKAAAVQASQARVSAEVQPFSNALPAMIGLGSLAAVLLTVAFLVLRPRPTPASAPRGRGGRGGGRGAGGDHRGAGEDRSRVASHAR